MQTRGFIEIMLDKMVAAHQVEFHYRDEVREAILRRCRHQYEHGKTNQPNLQHGQGGSGFMSTVRSLADIGKSFSHARMHDKERALHHADAASATADGRRTHAPRQTSPLRCAVSGFQALGKRHSFR